MAYTIAVTGKGGVGKTTISSLVLQWLVAQGRTPVLAVDADSNANLHEALGIAYDATVGGIREDAKKEANQLTGIAKQEFLDLRVQEALVEQAGYDLIVMGRPEGPGCYCFANNVLKTALGAIAKNYPYVVLDNEAGLENLSRRIAPKVDLLVLVADPSRRGLETLRRLYQLAREMDIAYGRLALVINRLRQDALPAEVAAIQAETGAHLVLGLPDDDEMAGLAERGGRMSELSAGNEVLRRVDGFLQQMKGDGR